MDTLQTLGVGFWEVLKFIFSLILNHLPHFLLMLFLGFILGLIVGFIVTRWCRKRALFSRPQKKKGYQLIAKFYRPLMFMTVLFLSMTVFTFWATSNIVKKEIHHGVESSFEYLEVHYLNDSTVKQDIYRKAELLLKGGAKLKTFNQAMGPAFLTLAADHENPSFLAEQLNRFLNVSFIEEKLIEIEKGILFYLGAKAIEKSGVEGLGELYDYDLFEKGFDKWYNLEWNTESIGLKNSISSLVNAQVSPLVFGLFLPALLIGIGLLLLPFIDYFFYSRKNAKTEASVKLSE